LPRLLRRRPLAEGLVGDPEVERDRSDRLARRLGQAHGLGPELGAVVTVRPPIPDSFRGRCRDVRCPRKRVSQSNSGDLLSRSSSMKRSRGQAGYFDSVSAVDAGLKARRSDGIASSAHLSMAFYLKDKSLGGCSGGPIPYRVVKRPAASRACRGEGFVLRETCQTASARRRAMSTRATFAPRWRPRRRLLRS